MTTMRDRGSSNWSSSTRKKSDFRPEQNSKVEHIGEGLGTVTICSGDSITTIEPLYSDDSSAAQYEARDYESSPVRPHNVESSSTRMLADPAHGTFLSWRSDPSKSFSDWKIKVSIVDGDRMVRSTLYHCHSNVLVWGPRKCQAFVKLFQEQMNQVPRPASTVIKLTLSEAMVFPMLLDFLYCATTFELSADSICSLYSLASKFEIELLQTAIQTFVEKTLNFNQSIDFLSCARDHPDWEKIEKLILFTNSRICGYLVKNPSKASKVPATILAHILLTRSQAIKVLREVNPRKFSVEWELERSRLLSSVVAICCVHSSRPPEEMAGEERLSRQVFRQLISSKHLPALSYEAALSLLQVDFILRVQEGGKDESRTSSKLSSFENRCADAIVAGWWDLLEKEPNAQLIEMLSHLKSLLLAEILIRVSRGFHSKVTNHGTPRRHDILEHLQSKRDTRKPAAKESRDVKSAKALNGDTRTLLRASLTDKEHWISSEDSSDSDSMTYSNDRYGVVRDGVEGM